MKRFIATVLLAGFSSLTQAYGLPYAVDSLPKAQAQARQGAGKHVLVFYTSPT